MLLGIVALLVFLALVFLGAPIAFSLFLTSCLGVFYLVGWNPMIGMGGGLFFRYIGDFTFSVIPLFVLMGHLAYQTGLLEDLFDMSRQWLGRLPGGLAIGVVAANTIFGACSGSSIAACTVIGKSSIPVMRKAGYSDEMSSGVVAAAGTLASIIPPSTAICIYGLLVDESIGKLLIAGILPGLLTALLYVVVIIALSRRMPIVHESVTWRTRLFALRHLWVMVVLVAAIMGSIYTGICTPTEAAAVGALVVFLLALVTRRLDWHKFWASLRATVKTTGQILIILVAAVFFARFLTLSGFGKGLTDFVTTAQLNPLVVFIGITLVYFLLGCFVGGTGMMVMTLPIFYPLMMGLGFNSLWFGIIVVVYVEMAVITPPVAVNLFAVRSIAPEIPMTSIIRGIIPYLFAQGAVMVLLYIFPQIVTFLPSLM